MEYHGISVAGSQRDSYDEERCELPRAYYVEHKLGCGASDE